MHAALRNGFPDPSTSWPQEKSFYPPEWMRSTYDLCVRIAIDPDKIRRSTQQTGRPRKLGRISVPCEQCPLDCKYVQVGTK